MGAFQRWLGEQQGNPSCCPDPEDYADPTCDYAHGSNDDLPPDAITAHGYDSRRTPVDTLMAGPVSMGLQHAHDMEFGDYA